jgi:hypothetical protein
VKLKKQKTILKTRLSKLASSELNPSIKFPIKDELIEVIDKKGRPVIPLPPPILKVDNRLLSSSLSSFAASSAYSHDEASADKVIHDAITIWNFLNSFHKQLSLTMISWDDFIDLLSFSEWSSPALIDLFSSLLKIILADNLSLQRIIATLPKKAHFAHSHSSSSASSLVTTTADLIAARENSVISATTASATASSLILPFSPYPYPLSSSSPSPVSVSLNFSSNIESFDSQYNGLKLLIPKRLKADLVDPLRWSAVLRTVFLRLEPVRQLRKAVHEASVAFQYHNSSSENNGSYCLTPGLFFSSSSSVPSAVSGTSASYFSSLLDLNSRYYQQSNSSLSSSSSASTDGNYNWTTGLKGKQVSFDTPFKPSSTSGSASLILANIDNGNAVKDGTGQGAATEGKRRIELSDATLAKINTPKSKSRHKSSGLNKDAIFQITSSFSSDLSAIYDVAAEIEEKEIHELSPVKKLILLKVLCDAMMETERIASLLTENAEERANQITAMNKMLKEQKAKLKEVSSAKRERAMEACRRINKAKAVIAQKEADKAKQQSAKKEGKGGGSGKKGKHANKEKEATDGNAESNEGESSSGKKGKKGSSAAKGDAAGTKGEKKESIDPSIEELSTMIDDLIALEQYGIDTVFEDLELEEVSDEEKEEREGSDAERDEERADSDSGGNCNTQRRKKGSRTRAMNKERTRNEKIQRNNLISYAIEKISSAVERNSEREIKNAIKVAERAGFRGEDEKTGLVYVTVALKNVRERMLFSLSVEFTVSRCFSSLCLIDVMFSRLIVN